MRSLALILLLAPALAFAQATSVRFTNATPPVTVPILNGSAPIIDQLGNIHAQCQLQPSLGICVGIDAAPAGVAPTLTFSRSGSGDVTAGNSATFTWSSSNSPELCFASASPSNADWAGSKALNGSQAVTFSATGSNTVNLKCYSNTGASPLRSVQVNVVAGTTPPPPPPPGGGCAVTKESIADPTQRALFQPDGFTRVDRSWQQFARAGSVYPTMALSEPYPVGTYTLNGGTYSPATSLRGKYITVAIVGNGSNYKFEWIQAKPVAVYNYQPARPTDFKYVTLSTCPGDFRTTSAFTAADPANDPTLIQQCRNQVIAETALSYGPTGFGRCPVVAGRTYYLNIVFADPAGGLSPSETGCRDTSAATCETSWKHLPDG